ncbi:cytochrome P450 [Rhizoclosmatium globosum]|uniref:Cytochrome P450 n=1 Tax=Rhizoclosmatium globosum TaxID=329046 RepID=A0A1Y2AQH9_9FUNG|nr:cytochrome P450 [Rhizoclosmatium globosum]|eukprot:ORY24801.1 cytochrome P450 [Rhizoclosmatium globosum]
MFLEVIGAIVAILFINVAWTYITALNRAASLRKLNPELLIRTIYFHVASPIRILDVSSELPISIYYQRTVQLTPIRTISQLIPKWVPSRIGSMNIFMYNFRSSSPENKGSNVLAIVDNKGINVLVADPLIAHDIMVNRYKELGKPTENKSLNLFGPSVVSTEGEVWRRHRRVTAPSFSEKNNALVHEAAVRVAREMFCAWEEHSTDTEEFTVQASQDVMQFALSVISSAGFGKDLPWGDDDDSLLTGNHTMSFKTAMQTVVSSLTLYLALPSIVFSLPLKPLLKARVARKEFSDYLDEMIDEAKHESNSESHNLLQALVKASLSTEKDGLSHEELRGNAFIFIFAGHETTASALAYSLALLAIHPEIQENLHNESVRVLGGRNEPDYSDFQKLTYALAVMSEALRLYSIVSGLPKCNGEKSTTIGNYVFPPNTTFHILQQSIQNSSEVWGEDVDKFRPERFLELGQPASTKTGWLPFSEGPRACVGKKFAQVESVALLTLISLKYKFKLPDGVSKETVCETNGLFMNKPDQPVRLMFMRR